MQSSFSIQPGSLLAGKYRVERVLGKGAMGAVLLVHHEHLEERFAIKVPLLEALASPQAVERFLREARAAVKIKSEYVARVSDFGTLETGEPFIVMEYLEGQDLAARLKERGALPVEEAVEFVLQACDALAEAHGLGIVHRDLKPANLYCVRRTDGTHAVKVVDFGISKLTQTEPGDQSLTQLGALLGSPLYMSPEQLVSSRDVDRRSDIWALGVILFELISRKAPFGGETLIALSMNISHAPPAALRALRPEVPHGLEQVIFRCLEKDRARRFQDVAELARALTGFAPARARASVDRIVRVVQELSDRTSDASRSPSPSPRPVNPDDARTLTFGDLTPDQTKQNFERTARPGSSRSRPFLIAGLGVLALTSVAGAWLWARLASPGVALVQTSASAATRNPPLVSAARRDMEPSIEPSAPAPTVAASIAVAASPSPLEPANLPTPLTRSVPTTQKRAATSARAPAGTPTNATPDVKRENSVPARPAPAPPSPLAVAATAAAPSPAPPPTTTPRKGRLGMELEK